MCGGCCVITECGDAAEANGERFGVFGAAWTAQSDQDGRSFIRQHLLRSHSDCAHVGTEEVQLGGAEVLLHLGPGRVLQFLSGLADYVWVVSVSHRHSLPHLPGLVLTGSDPGSCLNLGSEGSRVRARRS